MQLIYGDLFRPDTYSIKVKPDVWVITTNGFVKANGQAVMGRGCAKQMADMFPDLPKRLGTEIRQSGNKVHVLKLPDHIPVICFPVKPSLCKADKNNIVVHMQSRFEPGQVVPGWACKADMAIIERSLSELKDLVDKATRRGDVWANIIIPRPGCGAGELFWKDVKPLLQRYLDDRFYVITYE